MKANIKFDYAQDVECVVCGFKQPAEDLENNDNHICHDCGSNDWILEDTIKWQE